jgi:hypothetical protein
MLSPDKQLFQLHLSRRGILGTVLFLMIVGFAMRWYGLPERGIIARDEAWHLFSARGLQSRIEMVSISGIQQSPINNSLTPDFEMISSINVSGKPGYVASLWLIGFLKGSWDYQMLILLSVIAGTLCIAGTFWLARRAQFNQMQSIIAALFSLTSFTGLYFSRIGYPHILLILVHTFAIGFYLRSFVNRPVYPSLLFSGMLWGIGISMHMSLLLAMPGLFITECYRYWKNPNNRKVIVMMHLSVIGIGVLVVLIGWEILYQVSKEILGPGPGLISLSGSFFGDIMTHSKAGGFSFNNGIFEQILFYPLALLGMENPVMSLLMLIGIITLWRGKDNDDFLRILSILFLSNLVILILYPAQFGRQIAPLVAIWPVLAVRGLWETIIFVVNRVRFKKKTTHTFIPTAMIGMLMFNLYWDWPLLSAGSSGWHQAAKWIQTNDVNNRLNIALDISDMAIFDYYLPGRLTNLDRIKSSDTPVDIYWYLKGQTDHLSSSWPKISAALVNGQDPVMIFYDDWENLRPHRTIGGNWMLIPWWRWSERPSSFQVGLDDAVRIYSVGNR